VFILREQPANRRLRGGDHPRRRHGGGLMQASGGIDWMVKVAAGIIEAHPSRITYVAPPAFAFSVGAGTAILYPLMPVIYDVSYRNGIRPSRPMSVSVVQWAWPSRRRRSLPMAAMLTLTDLPPYDFDLAQILAVTMPSCLVGIVVTAFVVSHMGRTSRTTRVQEKIRTGQLPPIVGVTARRRAWRRA